jgi:hypothetical protein
VLVMADEERSKSRTKVTVIFDFKKLRVSRKNFLKKRRLHACNRKRSVLQIPLTLYRVIWFRRKPDPPAPAKQIDYIVISRRSTAFCNSVYRCFRSGLC